MKFSRLDIRDAFFKSLYGLAHNDKNIILLTDDLDALGVRHFAEDLPKQFINIGVSEQNSIDVAAGLATAGKKVFVFGICNYITMRCYEQIRFSVCSMNLPVVVVGLGAGYSFPFDGPTHHGVSDIAAMRLLPEMTILNPSEGFSSYSSAQIAYRSKGPVYVRLDKGIFPQLYKNSSDAVSGAKIVKPLSRTNILSTGLMTFNALSVATQLGMEGLEVGVIDIFRIKPINEKLVLMVAKSSRDVVVVEENNLSGNLGTIVVELLSDHFIPTKVHRFSLSDKQVLNYGSREWLQKLSQLDYKNLSKRLKKLRLVKN